jgi:hypothetical protein
MASIDMVLKELEQERNRLDRAIQVLASLNGDARDNKKKRVMSAAARRRIAAAQRLRWAKRKASQNKTAAAPRKHRISAAGIARIRAAAKARWARVRAAKKK